MGLNWLERGLKRVWISEKENFTKLLWKLYKREWVNIETIKEIRKKVFILLNRRNAKLKLTGKNASTSSITAFTWDKVNRLLI